MSRRALAADLGRRGGFAGRGCRPPHARPADRSRSSARRSAAPTSSGPAARSTPRRSPGCYAPRAADRRRAERRRCRAPSPGPAPGRRARCRPTPRSAWSTPAPLSYPPNDDAALDLSARGPAGAARGGRAGRRSPRRPRARPRRSGAAAAGDPDVTVTGAVPSILPWLAEPCLMPMPIRLGSGTRLKILEAFAAGCAVVGTAKAAEGLEVADGRDIRLAETPAGLRGGDPRALARSRRPRRPGGAQRSAWWRSAIPGRRRPGHRGQPADVRAGFPSRRPRDAAADLPDHRRRQERHHLARGLPGAASGSLLLAHQGAELLRARRERPPAGRAGAAARDRGRRSTTGPGPTGRAICRLFDGAEGKRGDRRGLGALSLLPGRAAAHPRDPAGCAPDRAAARPGQPTLLALQHEPPDPARAA